MYQVKYDSNNTGKQRVNISDLSMNIEIDKPISHTGLNSKSGGGSGGSGGGGGGCCCCCCCCGSGSASTTDINELIN